MASLAGALDRIKTTPLEVDLEGETLHVDIDASRFTVDQVVALATSADPGERVRLIVDMIHGWDLTTRDPLPGEDPRDLLVPITEEWFRTGEGSAYILGKLVGAMQEMAIPGEARSASGAG